MDNVHIDEDENSSTGSMGNPESPSRVLLDPEVYLREQDQEERDPSLTEGETEVERNRESAVTQDQRESGRQSRNRDQNRNAQPPAGRPGPPPPPQPQRRSQPQEAELRNQEQQRNPQSRVSGQERQSERRSRPQDTEGRAMSTQRAASTLRHSSRGRTSEPRSSRNQQQLIFCLVCGMATLGPEGSVFIQPCRCGYWVHDQCLINVALQFEDGNLDTRAIGCKVCRRAYNIEPAKSALLRYAVKFNTIWYHNFCHVVFETFLELVADVLFLKLGSAVFNEIYGPEKAKQLLITMRPLKAIYTCQLIPVVSIIIVNIPWERALLDLLRKFSRIPVLGYLFPMEDSEVEDIYRDRYLSSLDITGGLLLPFYAVFASRLYTNYVEGPFHRFLLGAATVVVLNGVVRMYYKQKKYVRYCTFTVGNAKDLNELE